MSRGSYDRLDDALAILAPVEGLGNHGPMVAEALCALGAQPSDDAGGYLCNAVFYRALWAHAQVPQRGFVHVPHGDPAPVLAFVRRAVGVLAQGPAQARDQAGIDQSMGA